ncbi:hypothetical protein MOP88_02150 [Sphingomonas sp. WKB10]|nr:hypothetical protein [Sphingomonas sp. WKB10]
MRGAALRARGDHCGTTVERNEAQAAGRDQATQAFLDAQLALHRLDRLAAGDVAGREDLDAGLLREPDEARGGGLARHVERADRGLGGDGRRRDPCGDRRDRNQRQTEDMTGAHGTPP